ncbi:hypothetical protein INR49_023070 [Caranx melampygus]|nr:hypothetical protein INR49_023070 [Caranx melampygus]
MKSNSTQAAGFTRVAQRLFHSVRRRTHHTGAGLCHPAAVKPQQPPVFQVLDPLLEVSMGGQAPIGGQQLAVTTLTRLQMSWILSWWKLPSTRAHQD